MQLVIVSKITMTALVSTLRLLCIEIHPCRIHPSFTIKQIYSIKKNETPFDIRLQNVHKFLSLCKRTAKGVLRKNR